LRNTKQIVRGREAVLQDLKESNDAISKIRAEASLNTYRRLNTRSNEKQREALSQDLDKPRETLSLDLEKSNDGVHSKILERGSGEGGEAAKARAETGLQEMTNHVLHTQIETAQHEFPMQKELVAPLVRVCARVHQHLWIATVCFAFSLFSFSVFPPVHEQTNNLPEPKFNSRPVVLRQISRPSAKSVDLLF